MTTTEDNWHQMGKTKEERKRMSPKQTPTIYILSACNQNSIIHAENRAVMDLARNGFQKKFKHPSKNDDGRSNESKDPAMEVIRWGWTHLALPQTAQGLVIHHEFQPRAETVLLLFSPWMYHGRGLIKSPSNPTETFLTPSVTLDDWFYGWEFLRVSADLWLYDGVSRRQEQFSVTENSELKTKKAGSSVPKAPAFRAILEWTLNILLPTWKLSRKKVWVLSCLGLGELYSEPKRKGKSTETNTNTNTPVL